VKRAALVLCLLSCMATGKEPESGITVSAVIRAAPDVPVKSFHWLLVELPAAVNGARTLHCRGRSLAKLTRADAQRNGNGLDEWRSRLAVGARTAGRTDSLVLCATSREGGGLKYLWSDAIVPAQGSELRAVDCWAGSSLELECTSTRLAVRSATPP